MSFHRRGAERIPPLGRLSEGIGLPDAEIRSGGTPAPTKVVTNVWSDEKPRKIHGFPVATSKPRERKSLLDDDQNDFGDYGSSMIEMVDLTSPSFIVGQLDSLCYNLVNPTSRRLAIKDRLVRGM